MPNDSVLFWFASCSSVGGGRFEGADSEKDCSGREINALDKERSPKVVNALADKKVFMVAEK